MNYFFQQRVIKSNPYHDPHTGEFTSRDHAGGGVGKVHEGRDKVAHDLIRTHLQGAGLKGTMKPVGEAVHVKHPVEHVKSQMEKNGWKQNGDHLEKAGYKATLSSAEGGTHVSMSRGAPKREAGPGGKTNFAPKPGESKQQREQRRSDAGVKLMHEVNSELSYSWTAHHQGKGLMEMGWDKTGHLTESDRQYIINQWSEGGTNHKWAKEEFGISVSVNTSSFREVPRKKKGEITIKFHAQVL